MYYYHETDSCIRTRRGKNEILSALLSMDPSYDNRRVVLMTKTSHRKKILVDPSEKSHWSLIKITQTKITVSSEN